MMGVKLVTRKEYWDFSSAVAERVLDMARAKPARWGQVIERLKDLPPPQKEAAFELLEQLVDNSDLEPEVRAEIWRSLDGLIRHHRAFSEADWALPSDDLERLSTIAERDSDSRVAFR